MKKRYGSIPGIKRILAVFTVIMGLILAGCSSKAASSPEIGAVQKMAEPEMHEAADVKDMAYDEAAAMAEPEALGEASGENGLTSNSTAVTGNGVGRKLIRTMDMRAETTEFDALLSQLTLKITQLGGYVENSQIYGRRIYGDGDSDAKSATITARVPAEKFDQLVTEVENNSNIIEQSENTSDVSLQYADLESRKKSLQIEQDRIWALLEKAEDMEAILTLETRLTDIRYELESMEGQLRLYDNQVSYSTINLTIDEVIKLTPEAKAPAVSPGERIKTGFSKSLQGVSNGFVNFFVMVISNLPYLAIWGVVLAGIYIVYRISRKKSAGTGFFSKKKEDSGEKKEK